MIIGYNICINFKTLYINLFSIGDVAKSNFLSRIYTSDEFNYANFPLSGLDYNSIDKQDAIVLNELKDIPQALQTTLKSFVAKGGNLVVIPSEESSPSNLNALLNNFGGVQFKSLNPTEKMVTKINYSHPLYSTVFEKKVSNFQYPNTKTSFALNSAAPLLLSYNDETPFLTAIQNGISSVYVFAAPINKANSNFQNSPLIVPTFFNMAQSTKKTGVNAITIGENQAFIIEALLSKDEIVSIKNDTKNSSERFIPVQQILNNKVKLTFNDNPKEAGNFGVFNTNEKIENISFNYSRTESDLQNPNTNIADDFKEISDIETVFNTLQADRTNNQLWKWFVILTLLFITFEVLIQKFVKWK